MKKILMSMAALSATALAAPVAAQTSGYQQNGYGNQRYQNRGDVGFNISARIQQLQMRLQAGVQTGSISRREAGQLRHQLVQLSNLERQYSRNGINPQERSDLQQRLRHVRQQIRQADGGNQARWDSYDREDGYGQYDRQDAYGQGRMDRNNDDYDDRDYDRDGRWDDDINNGGYQQPTQGGGIGGLIQDVLGVGGLRVGQRASANLGAVPYPYQNQFRDGNGSYYRSDGRQIYQIDARTQAVVRIFAMNP